MHQRRGVSLIEVIVVIGILAVLMALVIPAIMKARSAAQRAECINQQRQLGLALHQYAKDRSGSLPSIYPGKNDQPWQSLFYSLLPYVEHGSYYSEVQAGVRQPGSDHTVRAFLCPADPTLNPSKADGFASYAANAQVFGGPFKNWLSPDGRSGSFQSLSGPHLDRTFRDGTSATIMFGEHYAWPQKPSEVTQFTWFYHSFFRAPTGVFLRRATFADQECGDVFPVTSGSPPMSIGSVPSLSFQVRPTILECDPRIAQTGHAGGMCVGMGDGSVQILKSGLAPRIYWALVTPAGGEATDTDW